MFETSEEIENEELWARMFAEHPEVLEALVDEAAAEFEAGRTKPLFPFPP